MSAERHRLGDLIKRVERTNADGRYGVEDVRGVSNTKLIQKTKANMEGRDFTPFTILNPRSFSLIVGLTKLYLHNSQEKRTES